MRVPPICAIPLLVLGCTGGGDDFVPRTFVYENPVQAASPWPMFRRTVRNDGRSPVVPGATDRGPWKFHTGKGMFHAPAIGGDGTVYMGSADTFVYAIGRDGNEKWRFPTGDIVDSSALLGDDGTVYVPAGDGNLYALRPDGTEKWRLASPGAAGYITWWEGHVSMDRDGTLFAGNDDYHLYAISRDGSYLWDFAAADQVWSCPAFAPGGEIVFGSNDLSMRSIDHQGKLVAQWYTLGPVTSSPALSDDGSLAVFGSFDGHAYGVDPRKAGDPLWTIPLRDHVYASAAVAADGTFYLPSADGTLYAIAPDGKVKWAYDTLDPIRSSPAVDGAGTIWFGAGDGRLYALNPDGTRKWSYDTTESDRNDLNGSPAIALDGVVIGGESGDIHYVPFDWCERSGDARCILSPGEDVPPDGLHLYRYTSGGSSVAADCPDRVLGPTEVVTFRLVVRKDGDTVAARFDPASLAVTVKPEFDHRVEVSANGQFFSVVPLVARAPTTSYRVSFRGDYLVGGDRLGNKVSGGDKGGSFEAVFDFTPAPAGAALPISRTADATTVLRMRRIAVPQPPMMATFNQIGFDSYNYLLGLLRQDPATGAFLALAVGGTPGLDPHQDPATKSVFTLHGTSVGDFLALEGRGFTLDVSGVSIGMDLFRVAGRLAADLTSPSLNLYGEVVCAEVESFGPVLDILGLCNPDSGKLIANGTAMLAPHPGPEGRRPAVVIAAVQVEGAGADRAVVATFSGATLEAAEHLAAIVLVKAGTVDAVDLPYGAALSQVTDAQGHLTGVRLPVPASADLAGTEAIVVLDLFPVAEVPLAPR
jgi:outer membrane protein assembly factor BamB